MGRVLANKLKTPPKFSANSVEAQYFEDLNKRTSIAAVADLNQTIAGPSIAEVQAISDKVDALLAALRTAGVMKIG